MSRPAPRRAAASRLTARQRAARVRKLGRGIRLILLDVDGILTDGSIVLGEVGGEDVEIKAFSVHDGLGVTLARAGGFKVGILTGRTSRLVARRAAELKMDVVEQGHFDKTAAFEGILERLKLEAAEVAYMGDDLLDLRILTRVGLPITVPGAPPPVQRACLYVTRAAAGRGAVREVVDLLLELSGRTADAYQALGIELPES